MELKVEEKHKAYIRPATIQPYSTVYHEIFERSYQSYDVYDLSRQCNRLSCMCYSYCCDHVGEWINQSNHHFIYITVLGES